MKNIVSNAVNWFFESGKRVISTFANGIKSAFTGAVDAVMGGLQKIRTLLPFSDFKEGPLSTLTLSGSATMTTYAHGLGAGQDAPAQAMKKWALQGKAAGLNASPKKVSLTDTNGGKEDKAGGGSGEDSSGKQVIIQKLLIPVDLKKIKPRAASRCSGGRRTTPRPTAAKTRRATRMPLTPAKEGRNDVIYTEDQLVK